MNTRPSIFARQFIRETVLGRRGLIKMNSLWLPAGFILLGSTRIQASRPLFQPALLAAAVLCWSFASTAFNDLAERSEDRAAGKTRWMALLPDPIARLVPPVAAAAGFGVLVIAGAPPGAATAYAFAVILGAAYSLKPIRLKERGAWGLGAYALSCASANVILPWAWFRGEFAAIAVLGTAVFLDKWVNLHFHQVVDHGIDEAQGAATFAVRAGLEAARRSLRPGAVSASLALATAVAYGAWKHPEIAVPVLVVTTAVLALSAIHAALSRRRPVLLSDISRELPWYYLGLTLGVFRAVPLVLFWELARRARGLGPAFVVIAALLAAEWILSYRYRYE
jgi:hypothetical protein